MYKSKHTGNTIDEQIEKSLNGENIIENTVDYIDPLEPRPISSASIYKAIANEEFIPKDVLRIGNSLDDKRQKTYYGLKEYIRTITPNITTNANDFFNIEKFQSVDDFTTVEISPNIVDLNEENNGFIDADGFKKYINNLIEDYLKDKESIINALQNKLDESSAKALITSTLNYTREIIDDVDSLVLKSNDVIIGSISVADFIADRMLESVTPEEGTNNFIFTFKTGNGTTDSFKVDFTKYVDAYYADNQTLELDSKTKTFKVKENVFDKAGSANKVSQDLESYKQLVNASLTNKADSTGNYPNMSVGSAHDLTGRIEATPEEFKYRPSAGEKSIKDDSATIKRIKGNSVVWNQQSQVFSATYTQSSNGIDATPIFGTHYNECSGTTTTIEGDSSIYIDSSIDPKPQGVVGHKYLFLVEGCKTLQVTLYRFVSPSVRITNGGTIVTCTANDYIRYAIYIPTSTPAGTTINEKISVLFVDLTLMFGAGNEPTTVEEFYQRMPVGVDINAYNEGEIVNGNYEAIKTTGFNQWDEQWEKGYIVSTTGVPADSNNVIRTKNFIPVIPSASYYCKVLNSIAGNTHFYEYDEEYNFIKTIWSVGNRTNVISQNCRYIKASFGSVSTPATTYNNDICINLSHSGVRDGEYESYKEFTHDLSWIKKYFPNGMCGAGSIYDEISFDEATQKWVAIQRVGSVDLGSLAWDPYIPSTDVYRATISTLTLVKDFITYGNVISTKFKSARLQDVLNDTKQNNICSPHPTYHTIYVRASGYDSATSFRTAMSGVMLHYELAEPIVTEIDDIVNFSYEVGDFGTEEIISNGPTTPFKGDIVYQFNAVDRIRDNSRNIEKLNEKTSNKVDKVEGKGLSTNDYTNEEKAQVERVRNGSVVVDNTLSALDETSNKPVGSKAVAPIVKGVEQNNENIKAISLSLGNPLLREVSGWSKGYISASVGDTTSFNVALDPAFVHIKVSVKAGESYKVDIASRDWGGQKFLITNTEGLITEAVAMRNSPQTIQVNIVEDGYLVVNAAQAHEHHLYELVTFDKRIRELETSIAEELHGIQREIIDVYTTTAGREYSHKIDVSIPAGASVCISISSNGGIFKDDLIGSVNVQYTNSNVNIASSVSYLSGDIRFVAEDDISHIKLTRSMTGVIGSGEVTVIVSYESGGAVSEVLDAVNNYLGKHYGKKILTTVGYIHALQDVSVGSTLPTSMENIPSKSTGKIEVKAGQKVNLSTYITSGNAGYARAYYAVDNEGIIRQIAPSENLTDYSSGITITIEADGYLYIVCNNDHADVVSIDIVGGIDAKFEKILKRFDGEMVDLTYSYGFYHLSDSRVGDTFPAAAWESATKFCGRVDISSTSKIKLSTYVTSSTAGAARPWCLVDAQGVILDMAPSINTYDYQNGIVLDTKGAKYLYFCSDADYVSALSVEFIGLAQESSLLDEEIATSKQTNTPPIYLPHKTVMLSGASINQYNGYFEYAMRKMGLSGTNVSIAGYNILHLCHLLYTNSYEDIDLLILSHTHNFDVFTLPPSVIEYTVEEYEADAILAPYLTTGTYVGGFITPPDAYTVDEMYAIGYDYVIKKWVSKCYALRTNSSYDSLAGKLPQIMLYTYWHDGNKVFNKAIRKLAKKWNIPLIKDDENIGFTSERLHPVTKQQWSILYCNGVPWPATNVVDGITYGQHPSGIAQSDWDAFCAADAETMLSMLPDIQVKRASILMKMLSNCIM